MPGSSGLHQVCARYQPRAAPAAWLTGSCLWNCPELPLPAVPQVSVATMAPRIFPGSWGFDNALGGHF